MEENKDKVINFIKKSNNTEDSAEKKFLKEFPFIKITKDDNGNSFKEEYLLEYANKCFYIVTVLKNNGISPALYKYKVPYKLFFEFIDNFKTETNGKIIDIERYIPEEPA